MTKVFLDTNIIFKLFRAYLKYGVLTSSKLLQVRDRYYFVMSKYVLVELTRNIVLKCNLNIETVEDELETFLEMLQIQIYQDISLPGRVYHELVFHSNDAQILQDCHLSDCSMLLTENINDFDTLRIRNILNIEIMSYLL